MEMRDYNLGTVLILALLAFEPVIWCSCKEVYTAVALSAAIVMVISLLLGLLGIVASRKILVIDLETRSLVPMGQAHKYVVAETEKMTRKIYQMITKQK